jgi:hypothetical protein
MSASRCVARPCRELRPRRCSVADWCRAGARPVAEYRWLGVGEAADRETVRGEPGGPHDRDTGKRGQHLTVGAGQQLLQVNVQHSDIGAQEAVAGQSWARRCARCSASVVTADNAATRGTRTPRRWGRAGRWLGLAATAPWGLASRSDRRRCRWRCGCLGCGKPAAVGRGRLGGRLGGVRRAGRGSG